MEQDVRFPQQSINPEAKDVVSPLKEILQGLSVLPSDADMAKSGAAATFSGPPDSVAIIEAGATASSKWWSVAIAALGGTAVISAAATSFWNGQATDVRVGLIAGIAALLVAAVIAVAVIISSDVRGRAQGAAAQYAARASVANHFMQLSLLASRPTPTVGKGNPPDKAPTSGDQGETLNQLQEIQEILVGIAATPQQPTAPRSRWRGGSGTG